MSMFRCSHWSIRRITLDFIDDFFTIQMWPIFSPRNQQIILAPDLNSRSAAIRQGLKKIWPNKIDLNEWRVFNLKRHGTFTRFEAILPRINLQLPPYFTFLTDIYGFVVIMIPLWLIWSGLRKSLEREMLLGVIFLEGVPYRMLIWISIFIFHKYSRYCHG